MAKSRLYSLMEMHEMDGQNEEIEKLMDKNFYPNA